MISLALSTVRGRIPAFTGALVALLCSAILVSAAAHLTESGLRSTAPAHRDPPGAARGGGAPNKTAPPPPRQ